MLTFESLATGSFAHFVIAHKSLFVIVHIMSTSLGLGFAATTDYLFFKFLKDKVISGFEAEILNSFSKLIWGIILLILFTGVSLYIPRALELNADPRFLTKMFIVFILIFNGLAMNIGIGPELPRIFGVQRNGQLWRRLAFLHGSISSTSWFSAFFLGFYHDLGWSLEQYLFAYLGLLLCAVAGSQVIEFFY